MFKCYCSHCLNEAKTFCVTWCDMCGKEISGEDTYIVNVYPSNITNETQVNLQICRNCKEKKLNGKK